MIALSVVIPTHNRLSTLERCLAALEQQTLPRSQYEIIVVDDHSTDQTPVVMNQRPGIRFFRQPRNAGPSAARNVGIQAAQGDWIVLLGDDIVATPTLLEQHLQVHQEAPGEHIAVLGYTPWGEDEEITPLMRYLMSGGTFQQFRYYDIHDPNNVSYEFFYTSNISVSRQFLLRYGLFDEEFPYAYGEDTELAYRLSRHGLRIIFRRELLARHYHPTSYVSVRRRAILSSQITLLMARKHPELVDLSVIPDTSKPRIRTIIKRFVTEQLMDRLLDIADRQRWDHPLLMKLFDWNLSSHQFWALMDLVQQERLAAKQTTAAGRTTAS